MVTKDPSDWPELAPRARLLDEPPTQATSVAATIGPTMLDVLTARPAQTVLPGAIGQVADLVHPAPPVLADPAPLAARLPGASGQTEDEPFYLHREMRQVAIQVGLRTDLQRLPWDREERLLAKPAPQAAPFWEGDWGALGADQS